MSGISKKMMQAAGGSGGGPTGSYIAVGRTGAPYFTLLDHTTPGSVSLAATYTFSDEVRDTSFSPT